MPVVRAWMIKWQLSIVAIPVLKLNFANRPLSFIQSERVQVFPIEPATLLAAQQIQCRDVNPRRMHIIRLYVQFYDKRSSCRDGDIHTRKIQVREDLQTALGKFKRFLPKGYFKILQPSAIKVVTSGLTCGRWKKIGLPNVQVCTSAGTTSPPVAELSVKC